MDERAQRFWDAFWPDQPPTLTAPTISQALDRIKLEYLRALLPGVGTILEVGCGSARLSCLLALQGWRTVCLDFSHAALNAAQANYARARVSGQFVSGDAFSLPFSGERFHAVLSTGLLEHFPDPSPIVMEMVRVLKSGGLFYSDIVPKKFSLFRSLEWAAGLRRFLAGGGEVGEPFYEKAFSQREIRVLLEDAGLTGVRVFPAGVVPPYLPVLSRFPLLRRMQAGFVGGTRAFWKIWDGTQVAEWLGLYYFAWATKP